MATAVGLGRISEGSGRGSSEGDGRSLPEEEAGPCPNRQRVGALEVPNFSIFKPRSQQKARLRKILGEESDIIQDTRPCT